MVMKKKAKNTVKGMSLVEIIISMVVFGILALILVHVGEAVNNMHKNSVHVNRRVKIEEPLVVNADHDAAAGKDFVQLKDDNMRVTVQFDLGAAKRNVKVKGSRYGVEKSVDGKNADTSANANLEYVDMDIVTVLQFEKYEKTVGSDTYYYYKMVCPDLDDSDAYKYLWRCDGRYYKNASGVPANDEFLLADQKQMLIDKDLLDEADKDKPLDMGDYYDYVPEKSNLYVEPE
jgi:prepilin-type N-terminal cleavage/methylation domain-containing protein